MRLLLILLLFKTSTLFSQNENIIISQPETNTFYKGFSQIIRIGFSHKKVKKVKVICEKCDTTIHMEIHKKLDYNFHCPCGSKMTLIFYLKSPDVRSI